MAFTPASDKARLEPTLYYVHMTVRSIFGELMDSRAARRAMIDSQLRPEGVTDGAVLAAMGSVERENFVPEAARAFAYFDRTLPLGNGRAMMPPAALGRLLSELAPRAGERALVVAAGTGYSAGLL